MYFGHVILVDMEQIDGRGYIHWLRLVEHDIWNKAEIIKGHLDSGM